MTCSNCQAETSPGRKFCGQCGSPLALTCGRCSATNPVGARFCEECGSALEPGAAGGAAVAGPTASTPPQFETPAPREAETVELRFVSVLFADLVGFTPLAEGRDPEEVRELLSRYFEVCRELVQRYGGTVEKFIGDAVMAVWGTPLAQEDDAERAVRAALDLVEAVKSLGAEVGAPGLAARAGVLSGTAAVTKGATGQGMVAGDLVNTASRIQAQSEPGTVLVGEGTMRATEAAIAYADAGTHQLKGKGEPVALHRALRVVAGRGGLLKTQRLEAPFVGRERELRLVKEVFHTSTEDRRAHLVQVSGIGGIGKSRLAWEFFKYMDGLERGYLWHRGRCLAYGQGVTYFALSEMVRGRVGILEAEEHDSALAKLQQGVEQYVSDPDDRRFVIPRLAHLIGLEERTAPDKQDLFAAWRLFFERLAEQNPVVMVFEDMQWADPSLLEFIGYLMEWSRNYPLFVVSLVRPDVPAARLAATTRNATLIHLEPLSASAMDQLLTGLVPGLPPPLLDRIRERSEGIPLYAVETVRMLLDRGLLVEEGSAYRPTGAIETLEVPDTLHALILARLDGMSAEERQLAQDASVLGKTFTTQALSALVGRTESELGPLLSALVAKEVLVVQADPRSPERGQFGFLQDLVRTVAYETLSKRERRAKHLTVAAYLERIAAPETDELVEVVASHFLEAWRLDTGAPGSPEIKVKAREMLVRAAERAAALAAAEEAQSAFQQAIELSESELERATLSERAGEMAEVRGRVEVAEALYDEATELFRKAGAARSAARVQARVSGVEQARGRPERALERMRAAYAEMASEAPDADLAVVAAQFGRVLALTGNLDEAGPVLEKALELAEQLRLPEVFAQALSSKPIILMSQARLDESALLLRGALAVALEHELVPAAMRAYNNLAEVLTGQDRFAEVEALLGQQLELARRVGDRFWELTTLGTSLQVLTFLGKWEQATANAVVLRGAEELAALETAAAHLVKMSTIHIARGELAEAQAILDAGEFARDSEDWQIQWTYGLSQAQLLLAQGRPQDALGEIDRATSQRPESGLGPANALTKQAMVMTAEAALEIPDLRRCAQVLEEIGRLLPGQVSQWLAAQADRLSARLAILSGPPEAVERGFAAAEGGLRAVGTPFDLAVALAEHGEWLTQRGHAAEAETLHREARGVFLRLGARPWLERLGPGVGSESVPA